MRTSCILLPIFFVSLFAIFLCSCSHSLHEKRLVDVENMQYCKYVDYDPQKKQALLEDRVAKLWEIQVKRDRAKMYEYYDPFFRARAPKAWFISRGFPIYYKNPTIQDIEIQGNVARVRVHVSYYLKDAKVLGKTLNTKPKETLTDERWLFIDGTWYRQFIFPLSGDSYASY